MTKSRLHVVAGVLERDGRYFIQQRPPDKPLAGFWEFAGGKVERDETPWQALVRELDEELNIHVERGEPLIQLLHAYPDRDIFLDVWNVTRWQREPSAQEGQATGWFELKVIQDMPLLPANGPILNAMALPHRLLITPDNPLDDDDEFIASLLSAIRTHEHRACVLRQTTMSASRYATCAQKVKNALDSAANARSTCDLILHGEPCERAPLLESLSVNRLHVPSRCLPDLQTASELRLSASCHSRHELDLAVSAGAEFALLGAVTSTRSHPGGDLLGWDGFRHLVGETNLPVYAIGGMGPKDIVRSRLEGGQGIAAISAWWSGLDEV